MAVLTGCNLVQDIDRTGGNSERGYFRITPEGDLAEGGRLDIRIRDHETFGKGTKGIGLSEATTDDENVAVVTGFDSSGVVAVEGLAPGDTTLDFHAKADGDGKDDSTVLRVRAVTALSLFLCGPNPAALRDSDLEVHYTFNPGRERPVLGLGLYPFEIAPPRSIVHEADKSDTEVFAFHVPKEAPDVVTISSTLEGDDELLSIPVVDKADFDGVVGATGTARAYESMMLDLHPLSKGRMVCGRFARVVRTLTSDVCALATKADAQRKNHHDSLSTLDSVAYVHFYSKGACKLALEVADSALELALPPLTVEPSSSSGGGGGGIDWD